MKLFRPVGLKELELIGNSSNRAFPPRLNWQPIFYPVINFEYAAQIAEEWNTVDEFSGYAGFVTSFEVSAPFISKYQVQNVGGSNHIELWVPAEELEEFNSNIVDVIQVVASFYGEKYKGIVESTVHFKQMDIGAQVEAIKRNPEKLISSLRNERNLLLANFALWKSKALLSESIISEILKEWEKEFPRISLLRPY